MTYHCGITSPGKRWEPSYLALFKVRLDRTSEKNSVRNTPAQVGGWSKWLNTIGLSSFNRWNSLMHQTLPAGIARKKDPGVLSIKKLIDTFRSSRRHCKEQRRSVVRRGVQRYPPVSLLLGSLLFGEQLADRPAPRSLQEALGGLGRDSSSRRWEARSGGRGWGREGARSWSAFAFYLRETCLGFPGGSYLRLFLTAFAVRRKRCGNILEKWLLVSCVPFLLHLKHGDRE